MTRKPASQRISLDWSQLLGFDQLHRDAVTPQAAVGAKVGLKPTASLDGTLSRTRIGTKAGVKGGRIGAKVGVKGAPRR
jgi:hypothetical protein